MNAKENYLRAVRFEYPEYIPMTFAINGACYHSYPQEALFELMEQHKLLFPNFKAPKLPFVPEYSGNCSKDHPYTDDFGCVWETAMDGITGTVKGHPFADWSALDSYIPPDPDHSWGLGPIDWEKVEQEVKNTPDALHMPGLRHGHTFLQLCDLRGYEDLMFDMADEEPRLWKLIEMVEQFNMGTVQHYMKMDLDGFCYPEDLGMQYGPMLSPEHFRKYIKPSYERLMQPARDKGLLIHMHSDGDIRTLLDDIIDGGVQIINLQDLVNGIDWIAGRLSGKICVDLDIDRQKITACGTPKQIDELIREEVTKIGSKAGGLTMIFGLYPGTPLENVKALMDAMERYMGYYN